jgi:hypothetical protein
LAIDLNIALTGLISNTILSPTKTLPLWGNTTSKKKLRADLGLLLINFLITNSHTHTYYVPRSGQYGRYDGNNSNIPEEASMADIMVEIMQPLGD